MLRFTAGCVLVALALAACGNSAYAVRSVPRIAADSVGMPVSQLRAALGEPRKVESTSTKTTYVWFIEQVPAGAPAGFHGCEMEVTVDPRSDRVLGVSMSNMGWTKCPEIERKILIAQR
jgi:hypothetical protein